MVARFDVVQLDPARHPAARASEFMTVITVDDRGVSGVIPRPHLNGTPAYLPYWAAHGTYAWVGRAAWVPNHLIDDPSPAHPPSAQA